MRRFGPFALFGILVCVFLWKPIFTGAALLPGDYLAQMAPWNSVIEASDPPPQWNPLQWDAIAQFYPWRVFYARSMQAGHIPLWNPHQFCGTPFLANGQSACLYPFNVLFAILNSIAAFTVLAAVHLFLAQAFMFMLLRELSTSRTGAIVGAIVFAFSAFMVLWLELPTFAAAAVWLPLALLLTHRAVERRSILCGMLSGLALAMSILAGHLQIAFYVIFAAGLWWLWRLGVIWLKEGGRAASRAVAAPAAGCFILLALISAPQVLSTQELAMNSHRVREVTSEGYARFVANAVPLYRLVTAFEPDFFGSPARGNYFLGSAADYLEFGLYAGVLPLMLAVLGALQACRRRHAGFFVLLAALALLVALGTPLNALLYFGVPGFSALGGPQRVLLIYFFAISALAAFGVDYLAQEAAERGLWRGRQRNLTLLKGLLALHVVIFAGIGARIGAQGYLNALDMPEPPTGLRSGVYLGLLIASGLLIAARAAERVGVRAFLWLAVFLATADLFAFGINYNPTCERSKIYPDTQLTEKLQSLTKSGARIAPINPGWSLYFTPDAILPPNAAMVYGLYDVQGYDSLYTRAYKNISSALQGMDSSPPENGNMVLVRGYRPQVGRLAGIVLVRSEAPPGSLLELIDRADGLNLYRVLGTGEDNIPAPGERPLEYPGSPGRYVSPNEMIGTFLGGPTYPGWKMIYDGKKLDDWCLLGLAPRPGEEFDGRFVFEPFTFRFGLFLMCVGLGALTCAASWMCFGRRRDPQ